ncbi:hypothetical protein [Pedobacter yulinensis]|nr:hypothetical protein [Pedobacter yulinensis]
MKKSGNNSCLDFVYALGMREKRSWQAPGREAIGRSPEGPVTGTEFI